VELLDLTEELRQHLGAPKDAGVLVSRLAPGGPAAAAGVKVGDVVTSAGGKKVASAFDLARAVRGKKKGESLPLELVRDRKATSLPVTVGEREGGAVELQRLAVLADDEEEPLVRIDREQLRRIVERAREGARRVEVEVERRDGKRREMEQRLQEMEKRLQEMEQRLQDRTGR
jgi:membrane-associated protease RseP (regulator of RpoE activity)